jgi:hypothetical protein
MKIRPVGAESFPAGGRTNRRSERHEEGNCRFSKFFERTSKHTERTAHTESLLLK